ncbi:LPS-assembly protein LptD [Albidovulum sp.]
MGSAVRLLLGLARRLVLGLAAPGALALALAAPPARAQEQAVLIADRVALTGSDRLIAEGAVEIFYRGARLTAARIIYDRSTDRLAIEGPITLIDGSGTVMLADSADLSRDLTDGILRTARVMIDEQLQIAAAELSREGGRYLRMSRVVASSCQICPSNPTPLWEIRAERVIHDRLERQIYFDHAQFRVAGVPIFYLPRLRLPDPTLDRATGFLKPSVRTTSQLGPGLKLPYFITLGDSRDLTLTPYFATNRTSTLEFRYRQALAGGRFDVTGAVSRDDILPGQTRGYVFAEGRFGLPRGFTLDLQLQEASDRAYLLDYGISETDRLASGLTLGRTRRNENIDARLFRYRSIRAGDVNAVLPNLVGDLTFQRRFTPALLGGEGGFTFQLHSQWRSSSVDFDANGDGVTDGRDVSRASAIGDWKRNWIWDNGMLFSAGAELAADFYAISQDAAFPGTVARVTPTASVELRWPWVRTATRPGGAVHVLEPVVQLVVSPSSSDAVPNEDSRTVNFDEGNLFSYSRFPGADLREQGRRLNLGLGWTRHDPLGWSLGVVAGRVFRDEDLGQFSAGSGLDGTASDWLLAAHLETAGGLTLINRALFDDGLSFSRNELQIAYRQGGYDLGATYLWLVADPAEDRLVPISELEFDAGFDLSQHWRGALSGRYDFEARQATRVGLGLTYRNECASIDFSVSRRFTSSTTVSPSTDFNLSVQLSGFGSGNDGRAYRRSCIR